MSPYHQIIIAATGVGEKDAVYIEDIIRNDIFHSTLDWQSRATLVRAAKEAMGLLAEYRVAGLLPPVS